MGLWFVVTAALCVVTATAILFFSFLFFSFCWLAIAQVEWIPPPKINQQHGAAQSIGVVPALAHARALPQVLFPGPLPSFSFFGMPSCVNSWLSHTKREHPSPCTQTQFSTHLQNLSQGPVHTLRDSLLALQQCPGYTEQLSMLQDRSWVCTHFSSVNSFECDLNCFDKHSMHTVDGWICKAGLSRWMLDLQTNLLIGILADPWTCCGWWWHSNTQHECAWWRRVGGVSSSPQLRKKGT